MINVICAWCGCLLGLKPSNQNDVSHGICSLCRKQIEL